MSGKADDFHFDAAQIDLVAILDEAILEWLVGDHVFRGEFDHGGIAGHELGITPEPASTICREHHRFIFFADVRHVEQLIGADVVDMTMRAQRDHGQIGELLDKLPQVGQAQSGIDQCCPLVTDDQPHLLRVRRIGRLVARKGLVDFSDDVKAIADLAIHIGLAGTRLRRRAGGYGWL